MTFCLWARPRHFKFASFVPSNLRRTDNHKIKLDPMVTLHLLTVELFQNRCTRQTVVISSSHYAPTDNRSSFERTNHLQLLLIEITEIIQDRTYFFIADISDND